jgi:alkylhydroperoxidase/carboxymuconolactone decarboxylase family protein YurZ
MPARHLRHILAAGLGLCSEWPGGRKGRDPAPLFLRFAGTLPALEEIMAASTASPRDKVRNVVPKLIDLTEKVLFGDVWERPGLSKRDRSLITVAALIALYRPEQR